MDEHTHHKAIVLVIAESRGDKHLVLTGKIGAHEGFQLHPEVVKQRIAAVYIVGRFGIRHHLVYFQRCPVGAGHGDGSGFGKWCRPCSVDEAVTAVHIHQRRRQHTAVVADGNGGIIAIGSGAGDHEVYLAVGSQPGIKEPVDGLRSMLLHTGFKIFGVRMIVVPGIVIVVHARFKIVLAHILFQPVHHQRGLVVYVQPVVDLGKVGRGLLYGLVVVGVGLRIVYQGFVYSYPYTLGLCLLGYVAGGLLFVEGVHAFIHPGVVAFVGAQHAVKPVVAGLMHHHTFQRAYRSAVYDGNCGVLHTAAGMHIALHGLYRLVGIWAYPFAVVLHGLFEVVSSLHPLFLVHRQESGPCSNQFIIAGRVHGILAHHPALVCKPGKVVYAVFVVVQGLHCHVAGHRSLFVQGISRQGLFGQLVQPTVLLFIKAVAAGHYYIVSRQGDVHIIRSVIAVKLALVQVRDGMPSLAVVYSRLREPLRDKVGLPGMPHAGKHGGYLHFERRGDLDLLVRVQWGEQVYAGNVRCVFCAIVVYAGTIDGKLQAVYISLVLRFGIVKGGVAVLVQLLGKWGMVVLIGIWPEVYVYVLQRVGRIVGIGKFFVGAERIVVVVEGNIYFGIHLLLPVGLGSSRNGGKYGKEEQ